MTVRIGQADARSSSPLAERLEPDRIRLQGADLLLFLTRREA